MQVDDPPYLPVGTAVSAKYKGAFCEAKVSEVVRIVKCKVSFKMGLGTATITDEHVRGPLRVGQLVQAKHPEKKEYFDATITKLQDCSQYTVVFDDGDITTLRRTALCLKSGRHFNESETLDQLPLTHPEHFGNPVVGGRRGRRSRQPKSFRDDSSEEEIEEEHEPDLELYSVDIGRVVCVETSDKKKGKDNWFPGLIVMPSAQPTARINMKDDYLVRSFKDGRYYTVPKKEVTEFTRDMSSKIESSSLAESVEKVLQYLDNDILPVHWEKSTLFNTQMPYGTDSEDYCTDSSNDGSYEEKDHFVAQLYKFMDEAGTPLNQCPTIGNEDVDLYKLFKMVGKGGGYNRVSNQNKWRSITTRLKFTNPQATASQVRLVYKKCLYSFENFYRTLGVTMLNPSRSEKKNRGRSLIRDKDRTATPVDSPRPDRDDLEAVDRKEEDSGSSSRQEERPKSRRGEEKKAQRSVDAISDTNSSDATDQSEPQSSGGSSREVRWKRNVEGKSGGKERKVGGDKVKALVERFEEQVKDEDKGQQTRSKSSLASRSKEVSPEVKKEKTPSLDGTVRPSSSTAKRTVVKDDEKKRGRKRITSEDKAINSDSNNPETPTITQSTTSSQSVNINDKLKVYYGPTHESKVTYEAKVLEIDKDANGPIYLVHYTGWNTRYDEWIQPQRIAENLSAYVKAKRLKHSGTNTTKGAPSKPTAGKRGRGLSITGRSTIPDAPPRSTTPSSVTSSSSRTKSPATPATRGASRAATRLDSEVSESETEELTRTRSGGKVDEGEIRTYKKKKVATSKSEKRKDQSGEGETEKEEEVKRARRHQRKSPAESSKQSNDDSDDEGTNPPKGRDFDLNQIRSELKGFVKAVKVQSDAGDSKEVVTATSSSLSSSDDSNMPPEVKIEAEVEVVKKEQEDKSEDVYEFKEPEPFEFEKMAEEKSLKKRLVPRVFEEVEKSPKKPIKSPSKVEEDKKKFKKAKEDEEKKDPFDKLVESPSFQIVKSSSDKPADKPKVVKPLILEETLNLFKDLDDCDERLDISDNEELQSHPLFSHGDDIFAESTFSKVGPELADDCVGFKGELKKDSDDDDAIRASIQRVIAQTALTDDDSNDPLLFSSKKMVEEKVAERKEASSVATSSKQISPALQESDGNILESICGAKVDLLVTKVEEVKDVALKTGTKIADTILQKFVVMKNSKCEVPTEIKTKEETSKAEVKTEAAIETKDEEKKAKTTEKAKGKEGKMKRMTKVVSKEFIESDSDSSDSEQLVIAPSDDDSQTTASFHKPDFKESDSNASFPQPLMTDDSQSRDKFAVFEETKAVSDSSPAEEQQTKKETKPEPAKDEDECRLHSMLLCEETIPGSPPAAVEGPSEALEKPAKSRVVAVKEERASRGSALHEMPFASAPGSSNSKSNILENPPPAKENVHQPQFVGPLEPNTVIDNTPPTTPESTISNLSPRGENGDLSPNTPDNDESCKSEPETNYPNQRPKMSPYSDEDTILNSSETAAASKKDTATSAGACKKRRRSFKGPEDVPLKRGRKPAASSNRSRHNSDSDDASENSGTGLERSASYDRLARSPRPSKYNFFVELDPGLDSDQRIAVLQQKLQDLRKTYADVKAELATIERRRKKIRRREREALKAAKQETLCT